MNAVPDSIIVNSCQFTPVYLIQDPGAPQGQSYFFAPSSVEEPKPISDNLKSFYESSGNLDNHFVNVNTSPKPRILKKHDGGVVGNNLKLASFLLPKNESSNKHQYVLNNVVLKPNVTLSSTTHASNTANNTVNNIINNPVSTTSTINTVPRINIDSKIVKLKDTTFDGTTLKTVDGRRFNRVEKASPKINKPKEIPPILQTSAAPAKHTSVQLLKLGETYHSLNQLSDEQMKMVTQALKIFSNPETVAPEPAYDPVTNTQFIYRVVSPKDLTVVGKNKIITKEKKMYQDTNIEGNKAEVKMDHIIKTEIKKEITKEFPKKEILPKEVLKKDVLLHHNLIKEPLKDNVYKKENVVKQEVKKEINMKKNEAKLLKLKIQRDMEEERQIAEVMAEAVDETSPPKVTRSGRKVKLPKMNILQGITDKPKKKKKNNGQNKSYVSCFQCAMEFPSLYLLQKHYAMHPTHIPVKIHSNLFHCLLAIIKSGTDTDRTNIFIQQLEQLIVKLRSLLPCVLKSSEEEGKACTISEDVGRLLGVSPGKYHLDMEALSCVKNKDGHCNHCPTPKDMIQESNGMQSWITMNNEDILANTDMDTEDCARINSVEKWPTVNKRVWKQKQQKSQENAKRMRLASDNCDAIIELGMEDLVVPDQTNGCIEENNATTNEGAEYKPDIQISVEIEPFDSIKQEISPIIDEPSNITCTFDQSEDQVLQTDSVEDQKNHSQFYSAHFDIRSSPIKPTSTIFRKFQINPELLAKYEAQIIRSIETVDKEHDRDKNIPCPTVEEVLQTSDNSLRTSANILHPSENVLQTSADISNSNENVLQTSADISNSNENVLQTSADILNTNENVMQTSADILNTNENVLQTSADIFNTNENVLQTSAAILNNNQNVIQNSQDHTNKNVLHDSSNILHIDEQHELQTSPDILCVNENVLQTSQEVLQNNENELNSQDVLPSNEEVRDAFVNDDTLQEMFRDEDLSVVKESFILDRELKDWILNRSNDEKSEDGFSRSNTLIQPALLHVKDDEIKTDVNVSQKVELPTGDSHDDSSVLNFLDTLAADCLSYPGTEIRTNCGDFQIDLFSFNSS